jgi:hypothetical protein
MNGRRPQHPIRDRGGSGDQPGHAMAPHRSLDLEHLLRAPGEAEYDKGGKGTLWAA